jgi:hypothetical protein
VTSVQFINSDFKPLRYDWIGNIKSGDFTVYNIEVDVTHNYFVQAPDSESLVLVHNSCRVGGSGKQLSHTVKHSSRKNALEAATIESVKGKAPILHKATSVQPKHYHPVNSQGELIHTHHDFGKPNLNASK